MAKTIAWDWDKFPFVELMLEPKDGAFIILEKATDRSNPEMTFGKDQLKTLFQTMVDSKLSVGAVTLFGNEMKGDFPVSLEAAVLNSKGYNLAYTHEQLQSFKAVNFYLRVEFYKPMLWAFATPFVLGGNRKQAPKKERPVLNIQRAAEPGKPQAQQIRRAKAQA